MSSASGFRKMAQDATVYKLLGQSGASYVICWFDDGSVCAARKRPSDSRGVAWLEFDDKSKFTLHRVEWRESYGKAGNHPQTA